MWVLIKYKEPNDETVYEAVIQALSEDIGVDFFMAERDGQPTEIEDAELFLFEDELPQWYQDL